VYDFDPFFVELIPNEIVLDVLKEVLEIHVFDENYEEAIIIRDIIKEQMFDLS
jgi:protein-arginine kinase activator protein McsA